MPTGHSETWLYDEQAKRENDEQGHPTGTKILYADLPESLRVRLSELCYAIGNTALARIDLRVRLKQGDDSDNAEIIDYAFLEINPFPSGAEASSFGRAFRYTLANSNVLFDKFRVDMANIEYGKLCKMLTVCALIGSSPQDLGAFTSTENA